MTVEFDEDDVKASLSAGSPCESIVAPPASFPAEVLPVLLRVTGGRVCTGLPCCSLGVKGFADTNIPGDCDDMEVGVVFLLNAPGPGDSENLVDGLALYPLPLYAPLYL